MRLPQTLHPMTLAAATRRSMTVTPRHRLPARWGRRRRALPTARSGG